MLRDEIANIIMGTPITTRKSSFRCADAILALFKTRLEVVKDKTTEAEVADWARVEVTRPATWEEVNAFAERCAHAMNIRGDEYDWKFTLSSGARMRLKEEKC